MRDPIKLCTFGEEILLIGMNRIKGALDVKGKSQTELVNRLAKSFNKPISMLRIKVNLLSLSYIKLPNF